MKKKVGLMGGTFDPIHNGHLHIAAAAKREYGLSEVWFIPAGDPYFKAGKGVSPPKMRFLMTELALSGEKDFFACNIELKRSGPTYTAETLCALRAAYPDISFYFIIGADSLFQLRSWHRPELIMQSAVLLCAGRPSEKERSGKETAEDAEKSDEAAAAWKKSREESDARLDAEIAALCREYQSFGCDIRRIHCTEIPISSTEIRERVRKGLSVSSDVPAAVLAYIRREGLYRD